MKTTTSLVKPAGRFTRIARRFHKNQRGATMVEYALMLALVAIVGGAAFKLLMPHVTGAADTTGTTFGN